MKFLPTPIEGLWLIEPVVYKDDRGSFQETYNTAAFHNHGLGLEFVQDNQSRSKKDVIRGLHFQREPHGQAKLVRVIKGKAIDVALDLRQGSPTFGKHFAVELSGENSLMLMIPSGFAHGFAALEDDTVFAYKVSGLYNKEAEGGIRFDDPELGINWGVSQPIVSAKDLILPSWREFLRTRE